MKIVNGQQERLGFNDIRMGEIMTFPDSPGWRGHLFMRVYGDGDYHKANSELKCLELIMLDGDAYIYDSPRNYDPNKSNAGMSYRLTRDMIKKDTFAPVRVDATITIPEGMKL